ncbi:MAG: hypothetical protein ABI462_03930 [Ignavibacteria bacterium]
MKQFLIGNLIFIWNPSRAVSCIPSKTRVCEGEEFFKGSIYTHFCLGKKLYSLFKNTILIVKIIVWVLISSGLWSFVLFGYLGYIFLVLNSLGMFDSSSKEELIDNYNNKQTEILELKEYFNSIVPEEYSVFIEFDRNNKVDLRVYEVDIKNARRKEIPLFDEHPFDPFTYKERPMSAFDTTDYAPETKSLELVKQKLKWSDDTFKKIKEMLDRANCISVSNEEAYFVNESFSRSEPSEIGFARDGLGKYYYAIFNNAIPDSLKSHYDDKCNYIIFNDKVVLMYRGGAIGPNCFPD